MSSIHVPVLAGELVRLLAPSPGGVAVDCTFGSGGHARRIAEHLGPTGTLVCIDRDPAAAERFEELADEAGCETRFLRMDFAEGLGVLADEGLIADLVYFDLGVSSTQLDARDRGFSYSCDAPLDMRMDTDAGLDARAIVNEWDERRLAALFRDYGEERYARQIAGALARRREREPLDTTQELVEVIREAIPAPAWYRFAGGHPARRVFQAVRIAVNDELGLIDRALPAAWSLLRDGGRLGAVAFHSLEDRRVKRFLAARAQGCVCPPDLPICACGREPEAEVLTRRAVVPGACELAANPRSRSAKLRAARKLADPASARTTTSARS
jgi:16S rRNA (cytosine1402-N4)-methyltransferase